MTIRIDENTPREKKILLWCADGGTEYAWDTVRDCEVRQPVGWVFGRISTYPGLEDIPRGEGLSGDWTFTHWAPLPDEPKEG